MIAKRVRFPRRSGPAPEDQLSVQAIRDPHEQGDVETISGDAESFEEATPAPQQEHGDIVSTRLDHTATQVLIRVSFTDLSSGADDDSPAAFRVSAGLKKETGLSRAVELTSGLGSPPVRMLRPSDMAQVDCQLTHRFDYGHDAVTMSIPRTCLGSPEWVQVSVSSVAWLADRGSTVTVDDALLEGYDAFSTNMKDSPASTTRSASHVDATMRPQEDVSSAGSWPPDRMSCGVRWFQGTARVITCAESHGTGTVARRRRWQAVESSLWRQEQWDGPDPPGRRPLRERRRPRCHLPMPTVEVIRMDTPRTMRRWRDG